LIEREVAMMKPVIALAIGVSASWAVFAMDPDPSGQFALQIAGERTRADVRSEAIAAVSAGQLRPSNPDASAYVQPMLSSTKTRAQVEAEFRAKRAEATALTSEDSGSAYLANSGAARRMTEYVTTGQ
jgi:predicted polyphosphate/ATP-dependent NAD kinase